MPIKAIERLREANQRRASRKAGLVLLPTDEHDRINAMRDALIASHKALLAPLTPTEVDKHAARLTIDYELFELCDLCGTKMQHITDVSTCKWHIWNTEDMVPKWVGPGEWLVLCNECNTEEAANEELAAAEWAWENYIEEDAAYEAQKAVDLGTPTSALSKSKTTVGKGGYFGSKGVWQQYTPKCVTPHFNQLSGPDGYGYLRLASERGGLYIDVDVDYALFFSSGWKRLAEDAVTLVSVGDRPNTIPVFEDMDKSTWPPIALLDWPDMKAPPKFIEKYIQWTFDEWKSGKSIQFGCFGGHGRTGTFLAALMLLSGEVRTSKEAEEWAHDKYCKDAIETQAQLYFLDDLATDLYGSQEQRAALAALRVKRGISLRLPHLQEGGTPFGQPREKEGKA